MLELCTGGGEGVDSSLSCCITTPTVSYRYVYISLGLAEAFIRSLEKRERGGGRGGRGAQCQ